MVITADIKPGRVNPTLRTYMNKPTILVFVNHYLPGFKAGGPIRTIANLVEQLSDSFTFRIYTSDRDAGDNTPYPGVAVDEWNSVGSASVYYSSRRRSIRHMVNFLHQTPHDLLYLNSFFDPAFTLLPFVARQVVSSNARRPVVIAPRGEFSPGAIAIKRLKKQLYLKAVKTVGLVDGVVWHASSEYERIDIARHFPRLRTDIQVARNLAALPTAALPNHSVRSRAPGEHLKVAFLSRISPKKNLEYAIRVLLQATIPVEFAIFGPIRDDAYWRKCRALAAQLPNNIDFKYCGEVKNEDVGRTLARYDLLFLPTHGENYGHVIQEALSVGTPVLISDQTPWRNLVNMGVGWDLPLSKPNDFLDALQTLFEMSESKVKMQRRLAADYAASFVGNTAELEANLRLFRGALRKRYPSQV